MNRIIIISLLTLSSMAGFAQSKDIETLKKMNSEWLGSYAKKDSITLNRILAKDFVLISPNGTRMTKKDIIRNLRHQEIVSVNVDSIEVTLLTEDVSVVTGYATFVVKSDDKKITRQNCYQDVYVKRKTQWVAVKAHVTLLDSK